MPARDGFEAVPEQSVMNQKQIAFGANAGLDRGQAGIDRCRDLGHLSRALHLQPVQGARIVRHLRDPEITVQVRNNFVEVDGHE
jgi:hypothetical protein